MKRQVKRSSTEVCDNNNGYKSVMVKLPKHLFNGAKIAFLNDPEVNTWQALLERSVRDYVLRSIKKKDK